MGNIKVKVIPHAEYKGKKIVKINGWFKAEGQQRQYGSLSAATDSIK